MIYSLSQTVAPIAEPVTLAEAKLWARVDITDDDTLITSLITAAREYVEEVTKRQVMTATYTMGIDMFPFGVGDLRFFWNRFGTIDLPRAPLQSVSSVVYSAADGSGNVTLASNLYQVDIARIPGRLAPIYTQVWPMPQVMTFNAVVITFVCGWVSAAKVPERLKAAIKMMVATMYRNREVTAEQAGSELPAHFRGFLRTLSTGGYLAP